MNTCEVTIYLFIFVYTHPKKKKKILFYHYIHNRMLLQYLGLG